jgi:hypothetical protein
MIAVTRLKTMVAKSDHQSGQRSSKMFPSSSGASFCFIHRSGTYKITIRLKLSVAEEQDGSHQWKIALHSAEESLTV